MGYHRCTIPKSSKEGTASSARRRVFSLLIMVALGLNLFPFPVEAVPKDLSPKTPWKTAG